MTEPEAPSLSTTSTCSVLHMGCGKIGAGKSTLAKQLAAVPHTVVICEDDWLAQLYPDELRGLEDYARSARRLRAAMAGHIEDLLKAGISVVLDFPSNTVATRLWVRQIFEKAGASHQLHFLDISDEVCKSRLRARNLSGEHPFETTDAQFDQITSYFEAPTQVEAFNVIRHC